MATMIWITKLLFLATIALGIEDATVTPNVIADNCIVEGCPRFNPSCVLHTGARGKGPLFFLMISDEDLVEYYASRNPALAAHLTPPRADDASTPRPIAHEHEFSTTPVSTLSSTTSQSSVNNAHDPSSLYSLLREFLTTPPPPPPRSDTYSTPRSATSATYSTPRSAPYSTPRSATYSTPRSATYSTPRSATYSTPRSATYSTPRSATSASPSRSSFSTPIQTTPSPLSESRSSTSPSPPPILRSITSPPPPPTSSLSPHHSQTTTSPLPAASLTSPSPPTTSPRRLLDVDDEDGEITTEPNEVLQAEVGSSTRNPVEDLSGFFLVLASRSGKRHALELPYIPLERNDGVDHQKDSDYRVESSSPSYNVGSSPRKPNARARQRNDRKGNKKGYSAEHLHLTPGFDELIVIPGAEEFQNYDDKFVDYTYEDEDGNISINRYVYTSSCYPKTCSNGIKFYPHPKHCNSYFVCEDDGNVTRVVCPRDTMFNHKLGKCERTDINSETLCDPTLECS
ncbi:mucin-3A isoform X1 [Hyalella azteca]|uniref:Mucin-3A isoform X1 n=1 Tax=Hyalella azteca TaxID=294128 RepID=A0A8B7PIS9_HYAAZ|nr:mucin-3A isoform X1 [Hyalella azteca]